MAIVLVGMPASGKSTIGAQLAAELGWPFVDVDAMIEAESGRLIREIFADEGEARFRELEVDATLRALSRSAVVALGGGAVTSPVIRSALGGHEVVWLDVSVPVATRRAGMSQLRPLLLGDVRERMQKLAAERFPLYEAVATRRLKVDRLSVGQAVLQIRGGLQGSGPGEAAK